MSGATRVSIAVLAGALAAAPAARAQPAPDWEGAATTRSAELEAGGFLTDHSERWAKELLRRPNRGWLALRAYVPLDTAPVRGDLWVDVTTDLTGRLFFDGRLGDGSRLQLRLARDRFPFAAWLRDGIEPIEADEDTFDDLEVAFERGDLVWRKPIAALAGDVEVTAYYLRMNGKRPTLSAGLVSATPLEYAFGYPGYQDVDDRVGGGTVALSTVQAGFLFRVDAGFRYDALHSEVFLRDVVAGAVPAGFLRLRDDEDRFTLEAGVSAQSDHPAELLLGGSYRLRWVSGEPETRRTEEATAGANGSIVSDDDDVSLLRQRLALGAVWLPMRSLYVAGRIEGVGGRQSGESIQIRDLPTVEIADADSRWAPWGALARVDATWAPLAQLDLELEARGGVAKGEDRWNLTLLLADRETVAGERILDQDRTHTVGNLELRVATPLIPRTRLWVGGQLATVRDDVTFDEVVDFPPLGDIHVNREAVLAGFRTRAGRRLTLDGRFLLFFEQVHEQGAEPERRGIDGRLRGASVLGPVAFYVVGGVTDDRHDLDPEPTALPAGLAPIEYHGRYWLALAGAAVALPCSGTASATYTGVFNTLDVDSHLQDASATVTWPLTDALGLWGSARYLRFRDESMPWRRTDAYLALLALTGRF